MNLSKISLNRFLIALAVIVTTNVAAIGKANGSISQNPDDYDVPKYQRIYDDSNSRYQNAATLLNNLERRVQELTTESDRQVQRMNELANTISINQRNMQKASADIAQLRQSNQAARDEMDRLEKATPRLQETLREASVRLESLKGQLATAQENADRLDAIAKEKEKEAGSLAQAVEDNKKALQQARKEMSDAEASLKTAQESKGTLPATIAAQKSRLALIPSEKQAAQATVEAKKKLVAESEQHYKAAEAAAVEAETRAAEAEEREARNAHELREKANRARARANVDLQSFENFKKELAIAKKQLDSLTTEEAALTKALPENEKLLANLDQQITELKQKVATSQNAAQTAQRQLKEAQAALEANGAVKARQDAAQAAELVKTVRQSFKEQKDRTADLQARLDNNTERQNQLRSSIQHNRNEIQRLEAYVQTVNQENREHELKYDRMNRRYQETQAELATASRDRELAANSLRDYDRELRSASQRLQEVQTHFQKGIALATADGREDGSADGATEGTEEGKIAGVRDGKDVGEREGRERGTREGIKKAEDQGKSEGTRKGLEEGNRKGTSEGNAKAIEEGNRIGREQGLLAGFEKGKTEGDTLGYQDGLKAGRAMGAYEKGKAQGYEIGKTKAKTDAEAKGKPEGYRKGESQFYGAILSEITIPNRAVPASGVFARALASNNYRPDPNRVYPHPVLRKQYEDSYQQAFNQAAATAFDAARAQMYEVTRKQADSDAYNDYVNRDYSSYYTAARDAAEKKAYDTERAAAKELAFNKLYEPTRKAAYDAALGVRFDEGKAEGRRLGFARGKDEAYNSDLANGLVDGEKQGYGDTYEKALAQARKDGYDAAVAFFGADAVFQYDGALAKDANDDGVFAPGEGVSATIAIKNFATVSQKQDLQVRFSNASAGLVVERPNDVMTRISGQTRAVVTGIGGIRIAANAEVGSTQSIAVTVSYAGKVLGTGQLEFKVGYPYSVANVAAPQVVVPNQDNKVLLQIVNASSRTSSSDVTVQLVSLDNIARVTRTNVALGRLEAGGTVQAELAFTFAESDAFRSMAFEVQIYEGSWLLGTRRFSTASSKRWSFNANSFGLLLVSSGEAAEHSETAEKLAGLGMDFWDIRVEGELSAEAVAKYAGKTLVIPSVTPQFGAGTIAAVRSFLDRGGHLYAGLGAVSRTSALSPVIWNYARAVPQTQFQGLVVAQANFFAAQKYIILMTGDVLESNPQMLASNLVVFDVVQRRMVDKVTAYLSFLAARNTAQANMARAAILRDLIKEMKDDKEIDGENYKKNKDKLLLTAFVNTALSKTGEQRKALLKFYPDLDKAREDIGGIFDSRRKAIKKVLEPLSDAYDKEID